MYQVKCKYLGSSQNHVLFNLKPQILKFWCFEDLSKLKTVAITSSLILDYFIKLFHTLCVYHIHSLFYTFLYTFSLGIKSLSPHLPTFFLANL